MAAPSVGRYSVLKSLAHGEHGVVYLAQDTKLDRSVVVRVLSEEILRDGARCDRILHGLLEAARLRHPNIAVIFDVRHEEAQPFIVTEYIVGPTLAEMLREQPLPALRTLELSTDLASALAFAHRHNVVHGDLNPGTLRVDADGTLKVLNFGLGTPGWAHEVPGGLPAKANYLSPEQLRGREADQKSDVFAVGLLLYEMVSGRQAFPGESDQALVDRILHASPDAVAHLDPRIAAIVERCLEKNPTLRCGMDELRGVLHRLRNAVSGETDKGAPSYTLLSADYSPPPAPRRTEAPHDAAPGRRVDENVQFTVYRPAAVVPERWYPMLAFAHLAERRPDAAPDEPDPVAQVRSQAEQILGADTADSGPVTVDSSAPIPAEGHLRFIPRVPGVEFNPPERSCLWLESVHREEFRLRAGRALNGHTARGFVGVYLGPLLIADIAIAIAVDDGVAEKKSVVPETARPYRRIFASYSRRDTAVVEQFEQYARGFGDRYMRDVIDLRAGEVWTSRLGQMIDHADVFQLFWSSNSMGSPFVRSEWEHALAINRAHFIRPVYWEQPFPERGDLPPSSLRTLHFADVGPLVGRVTSGPSPAAPAPAESLEPLDDDEDMEMDPAEEETRLRAAAEVRRRDEVRAAIDTAERLLAADEFDAALRAADQLLSLKVDDTLRELRDRIKEAEQRRRQDQQGSQERAADAMRRAAMEARRAAAEHEARLREMESRRAAETARSLGAEPDASRAAEQVLRELAPPRVATPDAGDWPAPPRPVEMPRPGAAPRHRSPWRFVAIVAAASVVLALALRWC